MRLVWVFALMAVLIPYCKGQSQSVSSSSAAQSGGSLDLPMSPRGYKPKISLQSALKMAETYVAAKHIDVSDGWLLEARFFLYGDRAKADRDKKPCWLFVWNTGTSLGGYVDIIVSMDGKAMRSPTL